MNIKIQNRDWLFGAKIVAAIYQFPATLHTFYTVAQNAHRPGLFGQDWFAAFLAFMAILLIDVLLIGMLLALEDHRRGLLERFPMALTSLFLLGGIMYIGIQEEGHLAWIPRLGIAGLVLSSVLVWLSDVLVAWNADRSYKNSREYLDQKHINDQVKARRKATLRAQNDSLDDLEPELVDLWTARYRKQLGIDQLENDEFIETDQLEIENQESQILNIKEPIPTETPGVFQIGKHFGWTNGSNELKTETSLGKKYTYRGAVNARKRYENALHK